MVGRAAGSDEPGARPRGRNRAFSPGAGDQMLLSINAVSCDLDKAPTLVPTTAPFLKSINVGIPRIPNFAGVAWFSSTLSFATVSLPSYSLETSSRIGAIMRQGPHHSAQ